jgi:hypothetical protein
MVRADGRPRRHTDCQKRFSSQFPAVTHGQLTIPSVAFSSRLVGIYRSKHCAVAPLVPPHPSLPAALRLKRARGRRGNSRVCRFLSSGHSHLVKTLIQGSSLRPPKRTAYGCGILPLSRAYTLKCAKHDCLLIINDPQTNEVRATGGSDRHVRSKCQ